MNRRMAFVRHGMLERVELGEKYEPGKSELVPDFWRPLFAPRSLILSISTELP
jgi:hypothetical protein